jgi:hypothetical protein
MKQKLLLAACAMILAPVAAEAQYPSITDAAKAKIDSLQKVWTEHSDSAWAVAFPIVKKEAMEGRPYVPWAFRPYDLKQGINLSFCCICNTRILCFGSNRSQYHCTCCK